MKFEVEGDFLWDDEFLFFCGLDSWLFLVFDEM